MRTIKLYTILLAVLAVTACSQKEDLEEVQYKTATLSFSSGMSGLVTEEGRAVETGAFVPFMANITDAAGTIQKSVSSETSISVKVKATGNTQVTIDNIVADASDEAGLQYVLIGEDSRSVEIEANQSGSISLSFQRQCAGIVLEGNNIQTKIASDINAKFTPTTIILKKKDGTVAAVNMQDAFYFNPNEYVGAEIVIGGKLTFLGETSTSYYTISSGSLFAPNTKYTVEAIIIGKGSTDPNTPVYSSYIQFKLTKAEWNITDF